MVAADFEGLFCLLFWNGFDTEENIFIPYPLMQVVYDWFEDQFGKGKQGPGF